MDKELLRNASGIYDPTAAEALNNIINKQKETKTMDFKKGEIYEYISKNNNERRLALILSADNVKSKYVNLVVLQDIQYGENSVPVTTVEGIKYVELNKLSYSTEDFVGNYIQTISDKELGEVDNSLARVLGLKSAEKCIDIDCLENIKTFPVTSFAPETLEAVEIYDKELIEAKTEAKIYRELYEKLIEKAVV